MSKRKMIEKIFEEEDGDDNLELNDLYIDQNEMKELDKYKNIKIKDVGSEISEKLKKYKGKNVSYEEFKERSADKESEEVDEVNEVQEYSAQDDEEMDEHDDMHSNKENQVEGEFAINETIMDKEDEEYLKKITKSTPNEIKKGKNVANQKKIFDFFIGLRISMQKIISQINNFPQGIQLKAFIDDSTSQLLRLTVMDFLKLLTNFVSFQKVLFLKSNLNENHNNITEEIEKFINKIKTVASTISTSEAVIDLDDIVKMLNILNNNSTVLYEKIINIWYRKTLVYSYKTNTGNKLLKILNNNFCEHIKKNIESNYENARQKTKRKLVGGKILGKKSKNISEEYDDEVYNDNDFYNFLLKEFLNSKEDSTTNEGITSDNREDLTLKYLLNRNINKKLNKVDTRASKNRKLRFDKQEKLINFMVPVTNHKLNSGRDELINSIFGLNNKRGIDNAEPDSDFELI